MSHTTHRFTAYKFDPKWIKKETARHKRNVKKNLGRDDWLDYAMEVIEKRLKDAPKKNYRSYGPYWWALKKVLLAHGKAHGDMMDETIAREYKGSTEEETITAAEAFRDFYFSYYSVENNKFDLGCEDDDDYGGDWVLWDPDYEASTYYGRFAHLGLSEESQREWEQMAEFFGDDFLDR